MCVCVCICISLYFTAFLVFLMYWVWVIVRLWAVFCWTEARRQTGKPICAVFSLTACGCTVSEGKRRGESCCKREKRGKKDNTEHPVNKEKEKRFVFHSICEPVRGGRALNNQRRELFRLIRMCVFVCAHRFMRVRRKICVFLTVCTANVCKLAWIRAQACLSVCLMWVCVCTYASPSPSVRLYGGE